jgi:glutamine synthetase adenylyltransferase
MGDLRFGSTPSLLGRDGLPELTQSERLFLLESYLWYRKIETLLRLTLEERTTLLPEGGNLRTLALCAERQDEETFLRGVEERMKKVRGVFLAFCRRLEHH